MRDIVGRLSAQTWEYIRAEFEIRGTCRKALAARFGVDRMAVARMAQRHGWIQGKYQHLVEKMVCLIREIQEIHAQCLTLPKAQQKAVDRVACERLRAEGISVSVMVEFNLLANGRW